MWLVHKAARINLLQLLSVLFYRLYKFLHAANWWILPNANKHPSLIIQSISSICSMKVNTVYLSA